MPSPILKAAYDQLLVESGLEKLQVRQRPELEQTLAEHRIALLSAGCKQDEIDDTLHYLAQATEAPGFEKMICELSAEVEADIRALGCQLETEVYAGEYPTGDLNAQIRACSGGCLVLINTGLMMTIFLILKTMVRAMGFWTAGTEKGESRDYQTVVNELLPILQAYHFGDVRLARRREPVVGFGLRVLSPLVWQTEKFVVAHEYAHLLSGHVGPDGRAALDSAYRPVENISELHQQEYDADLQAVTILMSSADVAKGNDDFKFRIAGPFALLGIHDMITRVGDVLYQKPNGYSFTHPATSSRIEKLREHVRRKYGESALDHADFVGQWLKTYTDFIVTSEQEGKIFEPENCAALYRNIIAARDAATTQTDRVQCETDAVKLRDYWKAWRGEDTLHEVAIKLTTPINGSPD